MTLITSGFRPAHLSPVNFSGSSKAGKQASVPDDNDSDASSIHTNPEAQQMMTEVQQTLEDIKGQISPEKWAILNKGANFFQVEVNRLKQSGRKWQRDADNIGAEFIYTSDQLEKKNAQLNQALQAKQELELKYTEQGRTLKATQEQLADERRLDAEIERLSREAEEIREAIQARQST